MIIGIHGFKQSGKDTLADLLVREFGFTKIAFADKLKETLHLIFNVPKDKLWGSDEDKQSLTEVRWSDFSKIQRDDKIDSTFLSIRELMQIFATEVCRSEMPGIWYQFLDLKRSDKLIVSDVRFQNEADFLKSKGAFLFKVNRPAISGGIHASEAGLHDDLMDDIYLNDKSLEEFLESSKKRFEDWFSKYSN